MRHFLKIADNIDVVPILHSLALNADLWDENTLRTNHPNTAHGETSDIWVWFNEIPENLEDVINDIQTLPYRAWDTVQPLREIIHNLIRRVEGVQLGRVIITRIPPGKCITPHIDGGAPATFYTRYQIVLKSGPGCLFQIEDEGVTFRPGEVWWINNRAEHSVVNNSADERIVVIVDIRT